MESKDLHLINVRLPLKEESKLYELKASQGYLVSVDEQPERKKAEPDCMSILDWFAKSSGVSADGAVRIDLEGKLLLPGFVDAHMHLDKAYSLASVQNASGTLHEAIRNYGAAAPSFTKEQIKTRIRKAALRALSYGTTSIRSHLDFNCTEGVAVALRTVEAALEVKEELKAFLEIQLFPMCPMDRLGLKEREVLEEALRMGLDGIGGAPHLSSTPQTDIEQIFQLAERFDMPIDLHSDESDDPRSQTVVLIAEQTVSYGYQGRVTVGHLCSLSAMDEEAASRLIRKIADARLNVITLPAVNMYLQGRGDRGLIRRGTTRIKGLLEAGVNLATASDNIQDPFHPFGRGDMLQIGLLTAYAAHLGGSDEVRALLRMMTEKPSVIQGHTQYGVEELNPAVFVVIDAQAVNELFTEQPAGRWVYVRGQWVHASSRAALWGTKYLAELSKLTD